MRNIGIKVWLLAIAVGLVATVLLCWIFGLFEAETPTQVFRALSDGSFASGMLLLGMGGLVWAGNHGTYDGLAYSVKQLFIVMGSNKVMREKESFADYKERKSKKNSPFLHFIIVGGALIVLAIVFLILYYNI